VFYFNTTSIINYFIKIKLQKRYSIGKILRPLLKFFQRTFYGFRAKCLGRFGRKQRAQKYIFRVGKISLNQISSSISYSFETTPLRYGAVGIHIYISHK